MAIKESKKIEENASARCVAAIFGVTGLVGKELAKRLVHSSSKCQWKVYGIARAPPIKETIQNPNYHFISCNLQNPLETQQKLSSLSDVTHIFWVTWASQFPLDSPECCQENKVMMSNVLDVILPKAKELKHVSLQTGTKHYISLQEPSNNPPQVRYYDEQCPRASSGYNFYYVLEDLLQERLGGKIAWSIHRPGFILGCSHRTLYNLIASICVYGTICKKLKLPFLFGGTKECWEEMCIDASDARLVAEQHIWAATTESIQSPHGQAFNAINGWGFTWKEIWPAIGMKFGLEVMESDSVFGEDFMFSKNMADKGGVWKEIVMQEGLVQTEMNDLANWEFLDILFRFPRKMLATRDKVDGLGFTMRFQTLDSMLFWIDVMREEKLIP